MTDSKAENKIFNFALDEMMGVSASEFLPGSLLPADTYLKLADDKFVLIAREGSKAVFHEMRFNDKAVIDKFYVRREDYKKCVGKNLNIAGVIISSQNLSDSKKAEFLSVTSESVFKEISSLGFNHEALEHAKQVTRSIQTLIENKNDLFSIVSLMGQISDELTRHAMAVSAMSVAIARGMDWELPQTLEKLALGGLLHDVGMKELPRELLEKPRPEMTPDEIQVYEGHVFRGVEILKSMKSVPDEVVAIAYEHHENAIGLGYPRKLRDIRFSPLSRVVALADCFANLTLKNVNNPTPRSTEEAVSFIEVTLGQPYAKVVFSGLKKALAKNAKGAKLKKGA